MTAGLLGSGAQSQGGGAQRDALLFIRDAPRPAAREGPKRGLARLLAAAAAAEGGLDPEARALLLDLRPGCRPRAPGGPRRCTATAWSSAGGRWTPGAATTPPTWRRSAASWWPT